jgi:cephalosporin hydroxylase
MSGANTGDRRWPWSEWRLTRLVGLAALVRHTSNFEGVTWLGRPVWQNLADIWTVQETINELGVDFVIETGTNRGGSAFFIASVFDLLGRGHVVTIDVERLAELTHPRITFLTGSSTDPAIVGEVRRLVEEAAPSQILVLLDSDHSAEHVLRELQLYAEFVPVGGLLLCQDGSTDELPRFRSGRPGPLVALRRFLQEDDRFIVDVQRSRKYLFHHSPSGWLRRAR